MILAIGEPMFLFVIPTPILMVVALVANDPFKVAVLVFLVVSTASTVGYFPGTILA